MPDSTNNRRADFPNITISWWLSDVATSFMTCTFIGAAWGAFNPYPISYSTKQALMTKSTKFVPLPPFSSLISVGHYAGLFGSIAVVQRFTAGGMSVARNRQDKWNELLGVGAVYGYANILFKSDKRIAWNNRAIACMTIGSIVYSNTSP